jgi:hypothetical protein
VAPLLVVPLAGSAAAPGGPATPRPLASSIAVSWQRTAIDTIYTKGLKAPPEGALYLAFTSLAVHEAAREAQKHGTHAAAAAVATAAHDVLAHYFPTNLDAALGASLDMVPDGTKKDAGIAIGAAAASAMIASRDGEGGFPCPTVGCDDGRNDPSWVYAKSPAPGIWQPPVTTPTMALAWLGDVTPVIDVGPPVAVDGPDPLGSPAYARDYEEVRTLGGPANSTDRSAEQSDVARFFSGNPVSMYRTALCNLLEAAPLGLLPTTRLFARIDAAVANSFIQTWRLKFDYGYWRPVQAIAFEAVLPGDGDPATQPHPVTWTPLITNPRYPDYTTGHGAGTSPFAQVLRRTLGDDTHLVLTNPDLGMTRHYASLTELEHDALNARIWGGLHFRDAMEDGYYLGHTTADRVIQAIH